MMVVTLILSCATQEYVVQVSDRRLTRGEEIADDDANKAVLFCGRMESFGSSERYTEYMRENWVPETLAVLVIPCCTPRGSKR